MNRYMLLLLLISCREEPRLKVVESPYAYTPSSEVVEAENRFYYLLRCLSVRDSFRIKELQYVADGNVRLEKKMNDSARYYNKIIDSIANIK